MAEVIAFMDDHRGEHGVEPMCRVLNIAPSTWHEHAARQARPDLRPTWAKADEKLCAAILRVHAENFGVYGARPRRSGDRRPCRGGSRGLLARDGLAPAPAGGRRHRPRPSGAVDAQAGSRRRAPRKAREDNGRRQDGAVSARQGESPVHRRQAEPAPPGSPDPVAFGNRIDRLLSVNGRTTSPTSRPGRAWSASRARSGWRSSSTCSPGVPWSGIGTGGRARRRAPCSCSTRSNRRCTRQPADVIAHLVGKASGNSGWMRVRSVSSETVRQAVCPASFAVLVMDR